MGDAAGWKGDVTGTADGTALIGDDEGAGAESAARYLSEELMKWSGWREGGTGTYCGEPLIICTWNSSVVAAGSRGLELRINARERVEPGGPRMRSLSSCTRVSVHEFFYKRLSRCGGAGYFACRERPRTAAPSTLTMTSSAMILPQRSALPPGT